MLQTSGLDSAQAEDCAVREISNSHYLLTNIDIVTPIHDDPEIMGKIAATNAVNDLFAMNALDIMNYEAFLGLPFDLPKGTGAKILTGMRDLLKSVGADVHGGHTIQNPWLLMGGSTSALIEKKYMIPKRGVKKDDVLIITKPMGIQAIQAAERVMHSSPEYLEDYDLSKIQKGLEISTQCMTTPNIGIPKMIREYGFMGTIHAMTDVTGFGFKNHLGEMLLDTDMGAEIHELPVIMMTPQLDEDFGYGIVEGCGAEIAGAMLLAIGAERIPDVIQAMDDMKIWHHQVGTISDRVNTVKFMEDFHYMEIDHYY